jgi:hypothetical protein
MRAGINPAPYGHRAAIIGKIVKKSNVGDGFIPSRKTGRYALPYFCIISSRRKLFIALA